MVGPWCVDRYPYQLSERSIVSGDCFDSVVWINLSVHSHFVGLIRNGVLLGLAWKPSSSIGRGGTFGERIAKRHLSSAFQKEFDFLASLS